MAVRANRDAVLTLQSNVAREKAAVDEMLAGPKGGDRPAAPQHRRSGQPTAVENLRGTRTGRRAFRAAGGNVDKELGVDSNYVIDELDRLVRQGLFLVLLVIALLVLRRRAALWAQQDRSLASRPSRFSNGPLAAAFIVTMLLGNMFHPRAPAAWIDLMGLGILLALLRLLPKMLPPPMRSGAYLLALVYFLEKIMRPGARRQPRQPAGAPCPVARRCCVVSLALQQDSRRSRERLRWLDARRRLWWAGGVPGLRRRHRRQPHRQRRLCGSGGRRDAHQHLRGDSVLGSRRS